jgi:ABC-type antimicrobial peptide transport system permease subunit
MVGLYGVLSQIVVRRTRELSVRVALGATRQQVRRLVIRQGLMPVVAGLAVAVVLAVPVRLFAHNALDDVLAVEPALFAGVVLLFACCATLACYGPARRAALTDPIVALKDV